jgi:hypothetical protein
VVESGDVNALAEGILHLIEHPELATGLGKAARELIVQSTPGSTTRGARKRSTTRFWVYPVSADEPGGSQSTVHRLPVRVLFVYDHLGYPGAPPTG